MSLPPSQQTPPRPGPPAVTSTAVPPLVPTVEGTVPPSGYVMLPAPSVGQQPRPIQVIQGLDGMMYALTGPTTATDINHNIGSASPSKSSSISQLSQIGTVPPVPGAASTVMPQGLNFAAPPSAVLAAAAAAQVQAGAQVNVGALAAAAALQGQLNPSSHQFPFIPIYTPFSMPSSSLLTQSSAAAAQGLSLQSVPVGLGAQLPTPSLTTQSATGARTFLLPTQSAQQAAEDLSSVKRHKATSSSIQTLLAPSEVLSSDRRRKNQSRSVSSSSDCSPSPTVCKTEPFSSAWSKNSTVHMASASASAAVPLSKELQHSPASLATSSYGGPTDLIQSVLQRAGHDHDPQDVKASDEEQTKMETNPGPSSSSGPLQNVKSLSSLSRYVNHPVQAAAQTKQGTMTNIPGGSSLSLEKLLQAKPEAGDRETAQHASTISSLQGSTGASNDDRSTMMFNLLQEEPHLLQFYDFFCKSHLSKHLRIRILTTEGGANVLKWIEVTRQASHIDPSFGPVDAARIVISSNGLCKLQLMFPYSKTMSTRFVPTTMAQANDLFSELSLKHVVCPGLPDCENKLSSLGYQPTNIRIVETPIMKRYDHEKCPVWHIPLPCNIYSESGQILHHMCKQCKNLLSTLNKTITKIAGLNVSAVAAAAPKNHELPGYDLTMMGGHVQVSSRSASVSSGLSSPPYLLRPPPTAGAPGGQEGNASARETRGRKRKRRAHPKDDESSGSVATAKPTAILPEIYQLLCDPATVAAASHSLMTPPAPLSSSQHESVAMSSAASLSTSFSADKTIVSSSSEQTSNIIMVAAAPSSVIVQAKNHQEEIDSAAAASDTCSDSTAVKRSGVGECMPTNSAETELVQAEKFETPPEHTESPSLLEHEGHHSCNGNSPDDDREAEVSTRCSSSHTEDEEGEETDICSSPSPELEAENVDVETSVIKKPKIS